VSFTRSSVPHADSSVAQYRPEHPLDAIGEARTGITPPDFIGPETAMPDEQDMEKIMRSFWWPEPFDGSIPSQLSEGDVTAFGSSGFRPAGSAEYATSLQSGPAGNPSVPSFTSSMMNTGFDPSLGAPIHQLQQPVFHVSGLATPASHSQSVGGGMGDEFALFGTGGATSAMMDPIIGFLHEEPFY
jgi:hypothetical protein